jgi:hypothetical protein
VRERLKEPREGSEIEPEIMCVQGVGAPRGDCVLFVERSSELILFGKPKPFGGGTVKAKVNSLTKSTELDPKPGDLTMGRLKRR